jgi:hypothetical protein
VTGGFGLTAGNLHSALATNSLAAAKTVNINASFSSSFKDAAFFLHLYLGANRLEYHFVLGHSCLSFFF